MPELRGSAAILLVAGLLSGCFPAAGLHLMDPTTLTASPPIPKLIAEAEGQPQKPLPPEAVKSHQGPTVEALVDHFRCELAEDYFQHVPSADQFAHVDHGSDDLLWRHLVDNQFQVAAYFSVLVAHSEGLNPQLSFIAPKNYRGGTLQVVQPAKRSTTAPNLPINPMEPTAPYNLTLAVNGQANATQDNQFVLQYTIGVSDLISDIQSYEKLLGSDPCRGERKSGDAKTIDLMLDEAEPGTALRGSLDLDKTIGAGLAGIDLSTRRFVDPNGPSDIAVGAAAAVPAALGGSGLTTFSSKIDFNLVLGLNGGPSISLLGFKLNGGASGGGGGAGGASAGSGSGSGASSSSGGGSSGLLNATRTKTDTLLVTFSAACQPPAEMGDIEFSSETRSETHVGDGVALTLQIRLKKSPEGVDGVLADIALDPIRVSQDQPVSLPPNVGGVAVIYRHKPPRVGLGTEASTKLNAEIAKRTLHNLSSRSHPRTPAEDSITTKPDTTGLMTIKLSGYYNDEKHGRGTLFVTGLLTDPTTQVTYGSIGFIIDIDFDDQGKETLEVTDIVPSTQAAIALGAFPPKYVRSYWDTLRICNAGAPVDVEQLVNKLQQLNNSIADQRSGVP